MLVSEAMKRKTVNTTPTRNALNFKRKSALDQESGNVKRNTTSFVSAERSSQHPDKKSGMFFSDQGLELAQKPIFQVDDDENAKSTEKEVLANNRQIKAFRDSLATPKPISRDSLKQQFRDIPGEVSSSSEENSKAEFLSDREDNFDGILDKREQPDLDLAM